MSRVVTAFADLQDDGHIYNVGDEYPRAGVTVSEERLEELASNRNRRGEVLIIDDTPKEAFSEAKEDTTGAGQVLIPGTSAEAKERPRKGRKK